MAAQPGWMVGGTEGRRDGAPPALPALLHLSIESFLHSARRLSDAALLSVPQPGLLRKAVFLFLTEMIFRSITLRKPSYLSSIKLL